MKRTRIFTLVMAIFWTLIAVFAIVLIARGTGLKTEMNVLLVSLALVAVVGNWLRWLRSR
ncbi:MAG: hypothetical protein IJV40_15325 [Oscillospiraceae bacterium]|nr:hypothetical protein [Oscillospiraceae bacterium]